LAESGRDDADVAEDVLELELELSLRGRVFWRRRGEEDRVVCFGGRGGREPNIMLRPPMREFDLRVGESPPGPSVLQRPERLPPELPALPGLMLLMLMLLPAGLMSLMLLLLLLPKEKVSDWFGVGKERALRVVWSTTTGDAYGRSGPGSHTLTTPAPVGGE
jgi:hypothetical protein